MTLLAAYSAILATWVFWWAVLGGVGLLLCRALRWPLTGDGAPALTAFWTGWAGTLILLQGWHFFWPVGAGAAAAVMVLGGAGWFCARGAVSLAFWRRWGRREWLLSAGLALAALWAAARAIDGPAQYDSGLYHINAIRWIMTYPAVPGLGHLHGRLAFNQSYFLYAALLSTEPWAGRVGHIANGLLLLPLLARLAFTAWGPRQPDRPPLRRVERLLALLLLVPALEQTINVNISSPTPDMPVFILSAVLGLALLRLLAALAEAQRADDAALRPAFIMPLVLLGLVAPTVKLNLLVMGTLTPLLMIAVQQTRFMALAGDAASSPLPRLRRWAARLAVLGAVIYLPWVGRDVILSGWIGFPAPLLPVPVPWRLPLADVIKEFNGVRYFARNPLVVYSVVYQPLGRPWLETRVAGNPFSVELPLGIGLLILVLRLALERRPGPRRPLGRAFWIFWLPPVLSLIYWLLSAPDPRFFGATLWLATLGPLAFLLERFGAPPPRWVTALAAGVVLTQLAVASPHASRPRGPGADHGLHPTPRIHMEIYVTPSGLKLFWPSQLDQCWDEALPCTPYPRPTLRLRRPGDLSGGFMQTSIK